MTLDEMTLNGLIKQAHLLMMQVSSGDIPLTKDIELSFTRKDGEVVVKVEEKGDRVTTAQQAAKDYSDRMRTEMKGQSNGIALYEAFLAGVTYAQQHMTVTIKASDLLHGRRIAHVRPVPTSESKL